MKNLFILIVIAGCSLLTQAQGNLQFNQVISLNGSINLNATCSNTLVLHTVPSGKVLKIEYYEVITSGCQDHWLSINNNRIGSSAFPVWLKAGDVLSVHRTQGSCTGCATTSFTLSGRHYFSAIEFNVIL